MKAGARCLSCVGAFQLYRSMCTFTTAKGTQRRQLSSLRLQHGETHWARTSVSVAFLLTVLLFKSVCGGAGVHRCPPKAQAGHGCLWVIYILNNSFIAQFQSCFLRISFDLKTPFVNSSSFQKRGVHWRELREFPSDDTTRSQSYFLLSLFLVGACLFHGRERVI